MADKPIGSLSLDSALEDCEVGETKQFTVTVKVGMNGDSGFSGEVTSLENYEESNDGEPEDRELKPTGKKSDSRGLPSHVVMIGLGRK